MVYLSDYRRKRSQDQRTTIQGLGEMNPLQLRETTMDQKTLVALFQLTIDDNEPQPT